ncbi:hypothetical protein ACUOCP_55095, partial [Escherichia sp. R-CC3]
PTLLILDEPLQGLDPLNRQLNSDVQLINQLGYYIVSGGGKRIRPMIAVLAARAVGYEGNAHVVFFSDVRIVNVHQLQNFTF